ncbi:MAG: copper resistance protein CopC [Acidobacteriaceae bacterium]|nr:copper resistance protein CopC [Acidobacteriota bacterium]MBV8812710.1 copper resistance protein CopC [Acidobacteriaceae bacterium]MBV9503104.1 copper resistance protein CopC [Acidobacteriaceae bacterium]
MNARLRINHFRRQGRRASLAIICLFATVPLNGHAILKECSPAPHSIVSGPDINIRLRFNSRIDAAHSSLHLTIGSQSRDVKATAQAEPDTLLGQAKAVTAGEYRIQWQVLAIDGHITRGEVPFTVR